MFGLRDGRELKDLQKELFLQPAQQLKEPCAHVDVAETIMKWIFGWKQMASQVNFRHQAGLLMRLPIFVASDDEMP